MHLKFIGKDGSMGLEHGKVYNVDIIDKHSCIWVKWGYNKECPYDSPQSFAANWER